MSDYLSHDKNRLETVLNSTVKIAMEFLSGIENCPAGILQPSKFSNLPIKHDGMGVEDAIALFKNRYEP